MKLALISDLHIKKADPHNITNLFIKEIKSSKSDVVIIAGDISSRWKETLYLTEKIENESGIRLLYVPGNHDLWSNDFEKESTDFIYGKFLEDKRCLSGKPVVLENLSIAGDVGWYDYSFGSKDFSFADFERMEKDGRVWQDSIKNQWTKNNVLKNDFFVESLRKQLAEMKTEKKMLVTHVLCHNAFTVPEDWKNWKYFNAFLGSTKYMDLVLEQKVDYALCGHVHFRKSFEEKNTRWMCRCLGYSNEWHSSGENAEEEIQHAIEYINV